MITTTAPVINLDRPSDGTLHTRLYDNIRQAISDGRLAPGARLPSIRALASELALARGTVETVYARLSGEGVIVAQGSRGTIVSPAMEARPRPPAAEPLSARSAAPTLAIPFHVGLPALDLFPHAAWARLMIQAARRLPNRAPHYPAPAGHPALRDAIAGYLGVARGVSCDPARIFITGGYQGALDLATRLVLRAGDRVWIEDPGYAYARDALIAKDARLVPVPVDADGLRVEEGIALAPRARLAVVTPSHHSPLNVTLSQARRKQLLDWAQAVDAWIVEDDYDSEFHYLGFRPAALKSRDTGDRVFFAGSFSKTLLPSLRLGFLVVPEPFVGPAYATARVMHRGEADFLQVVLAAFITEGHFSRHLKRMRARYDLRRRALAIALRSSFGDAVTLRGQQGGLHILAGFEGLGPDVDLAARARARGLWASPLSAESLRHDAGQALMLGFSNIPEATAPAQAAALKRALVPD